MEKLVWEDKHWLKTLLLFFWTAFGLCLILIFLVNIRTVDLYSTLIIFLGVCMAAYFVLGASNSKLTYVSQTGICVGNAPNDTYHKIRLEEKPTFLDWNEIKSIRIKNKSVWHGWVHLSVPFLYVTTTKKNTYETFIAHPNEFTAALKHLSKEKLLETV